METEKTTLRQRSAPSLERTVQALRAIRGKKARIQPERRIIATRTGRLLV